MSTVINHIELSETLSITECSDGFYIWDELAEFNIAMKAKTTIEAFTEALTYYQERLQDIQQKYAVLSTHVNLFVSQLEEINQ